MRSISEKKYWSVKPSENRSVNVIRSLRLDEWCGASPLAGLGQQAPSFSPFCSPSRPDPAPHVAPSPAAPGSAPYNASGSQTGWSGYWTRYAGGLGREGDLYAGSNQWISPTLWAQTEPWGSPDQTQGQHWGPGGRSLQVKSGPQAISLRALSYRLAEEEFQGTFCLRLFKIFLLVKSSHNYLIL